MPKVLILTTSHGASHLRASEALRKAFLEIQPVITVSVVDAIAQCAFWFRAYYDSYVIPMRYWPSLWHRIEKHQHQSSTTNPEWLYSLGGRPLFRFLETIAADVVIATEIGISELAALHKRRTAARTLLVGLELMDFNRAWVKPEVDLYPVVHADFGDELAAAGAPCSKIIDCGLPIDPAYSNLPDRATARERLNLRADVPVLIVLFGGTGFGNPRKIMAELAKIREPFQANFVAGRNRGLERELRRLATSSGLTADWRVLGWVDNMHEWMAAADLLLSKPGGSTVMEAAACGLPLLAFDPLPGNEERTCGWLDKWRFGVWIRSAGEIAPTIARLLANPAERACLRDRARRLARPDAAHVTAEAILELLCARQAAEAQSE
ncbi:MAG: MGDG synthase family glycosyltransferase [Terriglobia bacterium]